MTASSLPFPLILLRVFTPFAAGYFLSYVYRTVNAVIAPDLAKSVALDATDLGLMTSAYFLTFALAQLPLGVALDRYGPRRVEAALLLFAGAGAAVFAIAETAEMLIAGRALVGFGVSACLMAAVKANVQWFPREKLPLANGLIMASGGLGALSATAPAAALLQVTDWRGLFLGLTIATFATSALLFTTVPDKKDGSVAVSSVAESLQGLSAIFRSPLFWGYAPMVMMSQGTFLAIQGLWLGPWLRDVAGLERPAAAGQLFAVAGAMVAGFILMGAVAERLSRIGIKPGTISVCGMAIFMIVEMLMITGWVPASTPLMIVLGFFGTSGTMSYAVLSQQFPSHLAGRVSTAVNLLIFIVAFSAQSGMGAIVNHWPAAQPGQYQPVGYHYAFGLMLALQLLAALWLVLSQRSKNSTAKMARKTTTPKP